MLVDLDARQRQEVVDQAAHAVGLLAHEAEEPAARGLVVAGGTLHGLDEAGQRGQRRAQLVAGIGHEIGPHALDLLFAGEIAEHQQRGTAQRRHMDIEAAGQRHAHFELHAMRLGPADGGMHRLQQGGRADRRRQMMAKGIGIESGAHMGIGGDDLAARRHHQHGIGQGHDQPLDAVIRCGHAFGIRLALAGCGCGLAEGPERRQQ